MFQQRPMPPMNTRGFFPPQGQIPMGRQGMPGPLMGRSQQLGAPMTPRGAGGGGLKGILSRILPGSQAAAAGNPQGFIGGANAVANVTRASGGLQGLMNPSNISGMLGNVQRVLGMAQQVTPMVQQYGPLVKNLPAMIKIYRELNSSSDDSDTTSEETLSTSNEEDVTTSQQSKTQATKKRKSTRLMDKEELQDNDATAPAPNKKRKPSPKSSQPKMYI